MKDAFEFGPFRLENNIVYSGANQRLELPEQAVKVLLVFLDHGLRRGAQSLSSEEIRKRAWPGRQVESNNLHQQIIRLRRELGPNVIVSAKGPRGYQFTLPVRMAGKIFSGRWQAISVLPFVCPPGFFQEEERLRIAGYHLALGIMQGLRGKTAIQIREISPEYLQPGWQPNTVRIAQEQRTELVLSGHLTALGEGAELRAQLIEAASLNILWAGRFDVTGGDSTAIEQEIVRQISEVLGLSSSPEPAMCAKSPPNAEAVARFRKGRYLYGSSYGLLNEAFEEYTYALTLDPTYAEPYVGIGDISVIRCAFGPAICAPNEGMPKALAAVTRALELDPCSSRAHGTRASVATLWEWKWELGEHHLREAIRYGPDNEFAHNWLGRLLAMRRDFNGAVKLAERAWELAPHLPYIGALLAWVYYFAERSPEGEELCNELIVKYPAFPVTHAVQGFVREGMGELEGAAESCRAAIGLGENLISMATLGNVCGRMGRREEAEQALHSLEELKTRQYVSPYQFAVVQAGMGNKPEAIRFLEAAVKERSEWISQLPIDYRLRSLFSEAPYQTIINKVGL